MKKYIQPSIVVTEVRALSPLAQSGLNLNGDGTGTATPNEVGPDIDDEGGAMVRRESGLSWDIF